MGGSLKPSPCGRSAERAVSGRLVRRGGRLTVLLALTQLAVNSARGSKWEGGERERRWGRAAIHSHGEEQAAAPYLAVLRLLALRALHEEAKKLRPLASRDGVLRDDAHDIRRCTPHNGPAPACTQRPLVSRPTRASERLERVITSHAGEASPGAKRHSETKMAKERSEVINHPFTSSVVVASDRTHV